MEVLNKPKPAWPTSPANLVANMTGHSKSVLALAFTGDRGLLASGSEDGSGRLWNVGSTNPGERARLSTHGDRFVSLAFATTSRMLAAGTASPGGVVRVFDATEKSPQELPALRGARGSINAVAFSPDGKVVAGAGEDLTLRVWECGPGSKGEPRTQLLGHTRSIRAVAFAPDGQGLVTGSDDSTARLWTVGRIRSWERANLPHPGEVKAVAWSADGKTVATAGQDGAIRLWDPLALKPSPRITLSGHGNAVRFLLMTPDSRTLVSVGDGPRVIHWDMMSGKPTREYEVPAGPLAGAALTPDGRYLAIGAADGTVSVYRVAEKRS